MKNKELLDNLQKEKEEILIEISTFEAKIRTSKQKLEAIDKLLGIYGPISVNLIGAEDNKILLGYPVDKNWAEKIKFVLIMLDKPLKASEIEDYLAANEPTGVVNNKTLPQTLWMLKKDGVLNHENMKYSIIKKFGSFKL